MTFATGLLLLALAGQAAPPAPPVPSPGPTPSPTPTPPQNPEPDGPVVLLETTMGNIKIGLYKTKAPISTENFRFEVGGSS